MYFTLVHLFCGRTKSLCPDPIVGLGARLKDNRLVLKLEKKTTDLPLVHLLENSLTYTRDSLYLRVVLSVKYVTIPILFTGYVEIMSVFQKY